MFSHKSKRLSKTLLLFVISTFLLLLCTGNAFRIQTPKLFGVVLLSLRRATEHRFK